MNWYSLSEMTTLFKRQYVTVDMSSNSSRKLMANELEMIQSIDKLLPLDIKYLQKLLLSSSPTPMLLTSYELEQPFQNYIHNNRCHSLQSTHRQQLILLVATYHHSLTDTFLELKSAFNSFLLFPTFNQRQNQQHSNLNSLSKQNHILSALLL